MKNERKILAADPALQALRDAVGKVIEDHRTRDKPLALWRDGRAVWVLPAQLSALHENTPPYQIKKKAASQ